MSTALLADITAPNINYYMLAPILVVLGGAVLSVLVEAFYPRESRRSAQLALVLATLVVAFLAVLNIKADSILGFTVVNSVAPNSERPVCATVPPRVAAIAWKP